MIAMGEACPRSYPILTTSPRRHAERHDLADALPSTRAEVAAYR